VPELAQPLDRWHFNQQRLLCLLGGRHVDAAFHLSAVLSVLFASVLQGQLGVASKHLSLERLFIRSRRIQDPLPLLAAVALATKVRPSPISQSTRWRPARL
jgi:hypothetical protein